MKEIEIPSHKRRVGFVLNGHIHVIHRVVCPVVAVLCQPLQGLLLRRLQHRVFGGQGVGNGRNVLVHQGRFVRIGILPIDLELGYSGIGGQNVPLQLLQIRSLWRVLHHFRIFVLIAHVVADTNKFLVTESASEKNDGDSYDIC